jgi:hypothetical protein
MNHMYESQPFDSIIGIAPRAFLVMLHPLFRAGWKTASRLHQASESSPSLSLFLLMVGLFRALRSSSTSKFTNCVKIQKRTDEPFKISFREGRSMGSGI